MALLNKRLADTIDLHGQMKHAHWNVRGENFIAIHELFDRVAAAVEEWSDLIAERAAALGGTASGTVQSVAGRTTLIPYPLAVASTKAHLFSVASALAAYGQAVRDASRASEISGDSDTADIFTEVSRSCDKHLWLVEAHAEP